MRWRRLAALLLTWFTLTVLFMFLAGELDGRFVRNVLRPQPSQVTPRRESSVSDPVTPRREIAILTYDHIRPGMTRAEAIAVVPLPPGDHYTGPRGRNWQEGPFVGNVVAHWGVGTVKPQNGRRVVTGDQGETLSLDEWIGDQYILRAFSDTNEKVVGCSLFEIFVPDRLRERWDLKGREPRSAAD